MINVFRRVKSFVAYTIVIEEGYKLHQLDAVRKVDGVVEAFCDLGDDKEHYLHVNIDPDFDHSSLWTKIEEAMNNEK